MWNALQDINFNTGQVKFDYNNYKEYSTIRSDFPIEDYDNTIEDEAENSIKGLVDAGYKLNDVKKMYIEEFMTSQNYSSPRDLALKLGLKDARRLPKLFKECDVNWPF